MLVVDDKPDDRMAVRQALEAQGFTLTEAANGEAGLASATAMKPDCILLDCRLPDYDGLEMLAALQRDDRLPCAVVMLTATSDATAAAALIKAGALDHLDKGHLDLENVRRAVRGAVERFRLLEERRQAEARNAQLAAIVSSSGDAIVSTGADDRVETWNPGAEQLFGYTAQEAVGRTIEELIVPDQFIEQRRKIYADVRTGRESIGLITERRRKDGRLVPVEINASPLLDSSGAVAGISVIFRDITERQRSEQRLLTIRDALSGSSSAGARPSETLPETRLVAQSDLPAAEARTRALAAAQLLDAPRDEAFDQVTRLASGVLQAPLSLATLIDETRQFFISSHGLPEPMHSERQKPVETSYCRHVIESGAPVVITNAELNPLVSDIGAWKEGFIA